MAISGKSDHPSFLQAPFLQHLYEQTKRCLGDICREWRRIGFSNESEFKTWFDYGMVTPNLPTIVARIPVSRAAEVVALQAELDEKAAPFKTSLHHGGEMETGTVELESCSLSLLPMQREDYAVAILPFRFKRRPMTFLSSDDWINQHVNGNSATLFNMLQEADPSDPSKEGSYSWIDRGFVLNHQISS